MECIVKTSNILIMYWPVVHRCITTCFLICTKTSHEGRYTTPVTKQSPSTTVSNKSKKFTSYVEKTPILHIHRQQPQRSYKALKLTKLNQILYTGHFSTSSLI